MQKHWAFTEKAKNRKGNIFSSLAFAEMKKISFSWKTDSGIQKYFWNNLIFNFETFCFVFKLHLNLVKMSGLPIFPFTFMLTSSQHSIFGSTSCVRLSAFVSFLDFLIA